MRKATGHHPGAAGGGRLRRHRRRHRRLPRAGRRLRLQPAEVQPRDAGLAPAGFRRSSPSSIRPRSTRAIRRARCILDAPLDMPGENAGADWSPQNDDGVFDGPITMRRAGAIEERAVRAPAARAGRCPMPTNSSASSASTWRASRPRTDPGARHRRRDAAADGRRLRGLRQRRLPRPALPDRPHRGRRRQGHRQQTKPPPRARKRSACSTRATPSSPTACCAT
jgi:hypothetical protein